jgi:predicted RNA-binding Zn-ribbon protein involved in translation (DUF1610 family)
MRRVQGGDGMMSAALIEKTMRDRAIDYVCPTCGAKAGTRCRTLSQNRTNPKRTSVDVRKYPCAERAALAWPAMLAEGLTA